MPLSGAFTKPIAGVPAIVWVGAVGGGLGLSFYLKKRRGGSTDGGTATIEDPVNPYEIDQAAYLPPTQGAITLPGGPAQNITLSPPRMETNRQWKQAALTLLIAQGVSPSAAERALDQYLNGNPMTPQETAVIDIALRQLSLPPEGKASTKPTLPPPDQLGGVISAPGSSISHRVREGDTLASIQRYFGASGVTGRVGCVGTVVSVLNPKPQSQWQNFVTSEQERIDRVKRGEGAKYC